MQTLFILNDLISSLPNITQKYFIDMKEISADKTFETMINLSKKLGFEPPKKEDKKLFEQQVYKNLYFILPLNLCIQAKDTTIKLQLTNQKSKGIDITQNLMPNSYQNHLDLENLKIYVKTNKEAQKATENLTICQQELTKILQALLQIVQMKSQRDLGEKDVLEYLKSHPKVAKDLKEILDNDLQVLKQTRPDIIESWKYYQEFEKLCEELQI